MAGRPLPDLEADAVGKPFGRIRIGGSIVVHVSIVAAIAAWAFIAGHLHGNEWGNNQPPGAIQATLVSSAPALPLPQDTPPTPNVLATETPSPAPAPPQPKAAPIPPPDAIPIAKKQPPPKKKEEPKKATPPAPKFSQPQPQQYRAQYGEAPATQMAHSTTATPDNKQNPVAVTGGSEGFNFGYYISIIQTKVRQNWYTQEVDPSTPSGSQVKVTFTISRDGTPSNFRISQGSGFPTLDSSALRAVQRVENFSSLPSGYDKSSLFVEYTFTYRQGSQ